MKLSLSSRLLLAVSTVLIAVLVTTQVDLIATRTPFALFFAAVIISARFGNQKISLLAIFLSALASDFFIIPPLYSLRPASLNLLQESVFVGVALLIVQLSSAQQQSRKSELESEERYRIIATTASDAIITIDESSQILFINPAGARMFGYSIDELQGKSLTTLMPMHQRSSHKAGVERYLETRHRRLDWNAIEVTGLHKDGHEMYLELSFGEFTQDNRQRFTGIVRDITERKRVERERERFFLLGGDILVIVGFDGLLKWVNPAAERALGWSMDELKSRSLIDLVEDEKAKVAKQMSDLVKGEEVTFESRFLHKDGSSRCLSWKASPYIAEQVIYAAATDTTERRALESQLRQSQKLESIGQLAGGIAHDFNNLLTVISGYSEISLNRTEAGSDLRRYIEEIIRASDRATSLTQQLLAFSRRQVLQPRVIDLSSVVADISTMLSRLIGESISLVTVLDPAVGMVLADPGQIQQVLMNLAVNARDAMPNGGKLTIETTNVVLEESYTRNHVGVSAGPYVMLAVSDTGTGIAAETLDHIFEPFFTTKEKGKGTGLGLAMVYGIVKQSGGHIWVYSEINHGTTFKIYLPLVVSEEINATPQAPPLPSRSMGTETILLVEDEPAVQTLLLQVLQGEGYSVLTASDGQEALDLCRSYKDPIHLVITDVIMPGITGPQLVEQMSATCAGVKVLFMSGYTDNAVVHYGVLASGFAFLQKPFTPEAVATKVREILDSP
jgi:two-component system, cell cycle sensor histidine kinase and response regulator CckA